MPNWVVPSIAAELWRIPLKEVMGRIERGSVRSHTQGGFIFVDIDLFSSPQPRSTPIEKRGPTYHVLTADELAALQCDVVPTPSIESLGGLERTHWRDARSIVKQQRVRPTAA